MEMSSLSRFQTPSSRNPVLIIVMQNQVDQAWRRDVNLPGNPSPIGLAVQGWVDTLRALQKMPLTFGVAVSGLVILQVTLDTVFPSAPGPLSVAKYARTIVEVGAGSFLLAPLAIAMHRFVLLNETDAAYTFSFRNSRFTRFYIAELGYSAIFYLPMLTMILVVNLLGKTPFAVLAGFVAIILVIVCFGLRALVLFPAIAVDAPGARWTNALTDSRGHTSLPTVPTTILYNYWTPGLYSLGYYAATILGCAEQAVFLAAMAAVASYLFAVFAQRLRSP
jgi:hypothetical protein